MHAYFIVDNLDTETASHNPHVPVEQSQGCLDELKQKLKAINVTPRPTEAVDTSLNPGLKQQKKAHHDALTKEKVFNSDADSTSDDSDVSNHLNLATKRRHYHKIHALYHLFTGS